MEEFLQYARDYGVWQLIGVYAAFQILKRPEGLAWILIGKHAEFLASMEATQKVQVASTAATAECLSELVTRFESLATHTDVTESQWRQVVEVSVDSLEMVAEKCDWPDEIRGMLQKVRNSIPRRKASA